MNNNLVAINCSNCVINLLRTRCDLNVQKLLLEQSIFAKSVILKILRTAKKSPEAKMLKCGLISFLTWF